MIRAFRLDWMMIRPRIITMAGLMVVICLWLAFQMRAFPGMYAAAVFMSYPMIAMSLGAYDESKGWSSLRLTMPVSRRDVVAGRYLMMASLALGGVAVASAVAALLLGADAVHTALLPDADPLLLPEMTADGMPQATLVATCLTLLVTTLMVAVVTPLNFRFGSSKVTMMLPYALLLVVLAAFALVGDVGDDILAAMPDLFAWLATIPGAVTASAVLLAAAAAVAGVSLVCSMVLYDHREM